MSRCLGLFLLLANTLFAGPKREVGETFFASILSLRPTQFTVGNTEVQRKADKIEEKSKEKLKRYLEKKTIPVVLGPDGVLFMIDHHHTAIALLRSGIHNAKVKIIADFSAPSKKEDFWKRMKENNYVYLYDQNGKGPLDPDTLPRTVNELKDDPYRALAGRVRNHKDFERSPQPYEEFAWAERFREEGFLKAYFKEKNPDKKQALFEEAVHKASEYRIDLGMKKCGKMLTKFYKKIRYD